MGDGHGAFRDLDPVEEPSWGNSWAAPFLYKLDRASDLVGVKEGLSRETEGSDRTGEGCT